MPPSNQNLLPSACKEILDACDPEDLPSLWVEFDRLALPPQERLANYVTIMRRSLLDEAVEEAKRRLVPLIGHDEQWISRAIEDQAKSSPSDELSECLNTFRLKGSPPPPELSDCRHQHAEFWSMMEGLDSQDPGNPGRILDFYLKPKAMLLWRVGYSDVVACLRRLNRWRLRCRTETSRVKAVEALVALTRNPEICEALNDTRSRHWPAAFRLFDDPWLLQLIELKAFNARTLARLLRHPSEDVVLAAAAKMPSLEEAMEGLRARPELRQKFSGGLTSKQFLSVLQDPPTSELPWWLVEEMVTRFPDTAVLSTIEQWIAWIKELKRLTWGWGWCPEEVAKNPKIPDAIRRSALSDLTKERLLELAESPQPPGPVAWIEEELMRRFPASRNQAEMDRWLTWLGPDETSKQGYLQHQYYERFAKEVGRPIVLRRRALAQIPATAIHYFVDGLDKDEVQNLFRDFDFASVSQAWCLAVATAQNARAISRRVFEHVVDPRTVRGGISPDQPAWMIEECARRLGVSQPLSLNGETPNGRPAFWVPRLLSEAGGADRRRRESRHCARMPALLEEFAECPLEKRVYFRLLENSPSSECEKYFYSDGQAFSGKRWTPPDAEPFPERDDDPLFVRLNSPRHFGIKPGWRIDYECRSYLGHHGDDHGNFISRLFTRRVGARSGYCTAMATGGLVSNLFTPRNILDDIPIDSVITSFDLEGIDLPNTEEALVELATILRLPTFTVANPRAWPEYPPLPHRIPEVVLGDDWSALTFYEEGRHYGEGQGNWGRVQKGYFQTEFVVIWKPFPLFAVQSFMIDCVTESKPM